MENRVRSMYGFGKLHAEDGYSQKVRYGPLVSVDTTGGFRSFAAPAKCLASITGSSHSQRFESFQRDGFTEVVKKLLSCKNQV